MSEILIEKSNNYLGSIGSIESMETIETIDNIELLVTDTDFDGELVTLVIEQLNSIGVSIDNSEYNSVAFAIEKVDMQIKNICNIQNLPYGLRSIAVDRVCGEVIYKKYLNKTLPENLDVDSAIKQLSIGDTTVTYSSSEPDKRVMALIGFLKSSGEGELLCYRKLTW